MLLLPAPIEDLIYISVIMLAAGRSERMGAPNKLLLPWKGETVLEGSLAPFCMLPFGEVVVVTGHEHGRIAETLEGLPVRLVQNENFAMGLSTSIRAGVLAANASSPDKGGYLFALGDMPLIRAETILKCCYDFLDRPPPLIVRPSFRGRAGHPVLFSHSFRDELLSLEGEAGARPILQNHRDSLLEIIVDDAGVMADLDTPEAYEAARG